MERISHHGYCPGHPWYYFLGGAVLSPKQILGEVKRSGYLGYREDEFRRVDEISEPKRSATLRALHEQERARLKADLSRYRDCARELSTYRAKERSELGVSCDGIHTAMSLKHTHIYNRLAHLVLLDDLSSKQDDLFG